MNEKGREIASEMEDVLDVPFAHFDSFREDRGTAYGKDNTLSVFYGNFLRRMRT